MRARRAARGAGGATASRHRARRDPTRGTAKAFVPSHAYEREDFHRLRERGPRDSRGSEANCSFSPRFSLRRSASHRSSAFRHSPRRPSRDRQPGSLRGDLRLPIPRDQRHAAKARQRCREAEPAHQGDGDRRTSDRYRHRGAARRRHRARTGRCRLLSQIGLRALGYRTRAPLVGVRSRRPHLSLARPVLRRARQYVLSRSGGSARPAHRLPCPLRSRAYDAGRESRFPARRSAFSCAD